MIVLVLVIIIFVRTFCISRNRTSSTTWSFDWLLRVINRKNVLKLRFSHLLNQNKSHTSDLQLRQWHGEHNLVHVLDLLDIYHKQNAFHNILMHCAQENISLNFILIIKHLLSILNTEPPIFSRFEKYESCLLFMVTLS